MRARRRTTGQRGLAAGAIQIMQAMYPDPNNLKQAVVRPKEQQLIESSYLNKCDAMDGIEDGILKRPKSLQI